MGEQRILLWFLNLIENGNVVAGSVNLLGNGLKIGYRISNMYKVSDI